MESFGDFSCGTISASSDFAGEAALRLCKEHTADAGNCRSRGWINGENLT